MTKTHKLKPVDDHKNLVQIMNHLLFDDLITSRNKRRPVEHDIKKNYNHKKKFDKLNNKHRFYNCQQPNNPYNLIYQKRQKPIPQQNYPDNYNNG